MIQVREQDRKDYRAIQGWNRTIEHLEKYKDGIVFFGNSITFYGDWETFFKNRTHLPVLVMGYPGDDLKGMLLRTEPLRKLTPKIIFVMAGINGLKGMTLAEFKTQYDALVCNIMNKTPTSYICLESIIPVDKEDFKELDDYADNAKIKQANMVISDIAQKHGLQYIDVYHLFCRKGKVERSKYRDGVHPTSEAYLPWYQLLSSCLNSKR